MHVGKVVMIVKDIFQSPVNQLGEAKTKTVPRIAQHDSSRPQTGPNFSSPETPLWKAYIKIGRKLQ